MALLQDGQLYLGTADEGAGPPQYLPLDMANRHGLLTGATGPGTPDTHQLQPEGYADAGVPVFCADIKGDLSGLSKAGTEKDFLEKRARIIGLGDEYQYRATEATFWDLYGVEGHPIRTTVTEMGPLILARLLNLNDTQEGVLNIAFRMADDEGLAILDLKDLRALMVHVADHAAELSRVYGLVSPGSIGAVQRSLLVLEQQGGDQFFGEPAFRIQDLMRTTRDGRGVVNILAADALMQAPKLYATFLLWLLSELFEELPEVGDPDRPRLVFFFDEAHLLFSEAPKSLVRQVETVVRLIRSKGVGVYFVTQNPLDLPDSVLGQLGNRVQHALRAFTPRDQKAVKAAADTFRPNPALDTEQVITELGVGEALVSTLEDKGAPGMVQRTLIRPPAGRLGPITAEERKAMMAVDPMGAAYDTPVDRESAYEILKKRAEAQVQTQADMPPEAPTRKAEPADEPEPEPRGPGLWESVFGGGRKRLSSTQKAARSAGRDMASMVGGAIGKAVAGQSGAKVGKALARGMFGNLLR